MTIYFGLQFDETIYPKNVAPEGAVHYFGPQGLLFMLESHLGHIGHPSDNEHIRIEQYRQALKQHFQSDSSAFYARSFEADQLATAARLLQLRDELRLANWDFNSNPETPLRLSSIAEIEEHLQSTDKKLSPGFADRFLDILNSLEKNIVPIDSIFINEPLDLLPSHYQRLFKTFKNKGVNIKQIPDSIAGSNTDLGLFKQFLKRENNAKKHSLSADGSLFILKAKRETEAAVFIAKLLKENKGFQPVCLIPEKNRALDNAIIQEGLPSFGILSASLARPSLQILKLATAFLWHPIDPYKVMEFVSLGLKPLDDELAELIANLMAQRPGQNSEIWFGAINGFFDDLQKRSEKDKSLNPVDVRAQYDFWFSRKRFDINKKVPKSDVINIFEYISKWVRDLLDESNQKQNSLIVLGEQAKRIVDLLYALPDSEEELSHLELERIVRTIYKPSPVQFTDTALGHFPFVYNSSAIIKPVEELLWWNFSSLEQEHFFSNWYKTEFDYLKAKGIFLQTPADENTLLLWQRPRAIHQTQGRLLIVIPNKVDGTDVFPHPLYDELQATFANLAPITYNINGFNSKNNCLETYFNLPKIEQLSFRRLGSPQPFIQIDQSDKFEHRAEETFTSLDSLFYYPYQWVFRYKIKLRKSSILSIVKDVTLMGNLAHRFFELIFAQDNIETWNKGQVNQWVDENANGLLSREGAVLLMYGREPERIAFISKVKYAIWSLLVLIKNNGWTIEGTEVSAGGSFLGIPLKAKADLVLKRGTEKMVLDLKWRGAARRENMISNEEDLQLITYSKLLSEGNSSAHTAFFIIEKGQAIARNNLAFKELTGIAPESLHEEVNERIWQKMKATFEWRMTQLKNGLIEVRTEQTLNEIEEIYGEEIFDLLEMKDRNAPFDDYQTLINLIE